MPESDILQLNDLTQVATGVYQLPGHVEEDTTPIQDQSVEHFLETTFKNTPDLSTTSTKLSDCIFDWPSEFHLSSERANLLRWIAFSKISSVLEIGAGCGAITRFLGEQGVLVDAIETNSKHARLCLARCQELDNVRVINEKLANLSLPSKHYDLVVYIDGIDQNNNTNVDQTLGVLQQAKQSMSENGLMIIAADNRLGLKYIQGAHENQHTKRYAGINNYKDTANKKNPNFSQEQWQDIISNAGYEITATTYPFPDHRVPQVLLRDEYVTQNKYAFNHLLGIETRDYFSMQNKSIHEMISWQAANQGGYFGLVANSFCFILGAHQKVVDNVANFDFMHVSNITRNLQFANITQKPMGQDVVIKSYINDAHKKQKNKATDLIQTLDEQSFYYGNVLHYDWLISFVAEQGGGHFETLIKEYYQFLVKRQEQGLPLTLDLIPINIIIDEQKEYQVFDQEWQHKKQLSPQYLLFRAALIFITKEWRLLEEGLSWLEIKTVYGFISHVFRVNVLPLAIGIKQFIKLEQVFQHAVSKPGLYDISVADMLEITFDFHPENDVFYSQCCWSSEATSDKKAPIFKPQNVISIQQNLKENTSNLTFDLPPEVTQLSAIRFDPFDIRKHHSIKSYQLTSIAIYETDSHHKELRWRLEGADEIAKNCWPESTIFVEQNDHTTWVASSDFPKMSFVIGSLSKNSNASKWQIEVSVFINPHSDNHAVADQLKSKINTHLKEVSHLTELTQSLHDLIQSSNKIINSQRKDLATLQSELSQVRFEAAQKYRFLRKCKRGIVVIISSLKK